MWTNNWRDSIWSALDQPWDLVIVGGGITGAGMLREASRAGLRTLLLEQGDFASGTSSRSSKLVHGGFRYLRNAQILVTLQSVRERDRLLREGKGLINRLGFLFTTLVGDPLPGWVFGLGLGMYDLLGLKWNHQHYDVKGLRALCPPLTTPALLGGYRYFDALTDDARLVLRLIREAVAGGGAALNYARVTSLVRNQGGQVCGVAVKDLAPQGQGRTVEVRTPIVVNATGAWADVLRAKIKRPPRLRTLRGSHLIFPARRLPLKRAVSLLHPRDRRPVFAFPWEGVTLLGTTDVDRQGLVESDPSISPAEADYLIRAVQFAFPGLKLTLDDVQATFSGVRAVVNTGKANPSKESREHIIWEEDGLLTVSGGKLTTFRIMAHGALRALRNRLPRGVRLDRRQPVLDQPEELAFSWAGLDPPARLRLLGRYAADTASLLAAAQAGELAPIPGSPYSWAELRWAARAEGVIHLDDLLLRRVRLGLLLPGGGQQEMARIRAISQPELGWEDARWEQEESAYRSLWGNSYSLGE